MRQARGGRPRRSRRTPGEISDLIKPAGSLSPDAPLAEQIAYHERKAHLLSRIAALGTPEAHQVPADGWHLVYGLARQRDLKPDSEATR